MEEIYVVKVRTEPDPARLYPSERRYSALTVGGLGAVHLLLAATSLLLGGLGMALQSDSCWTGRYGGGLWLGLAAGAAGAAGILAWRRWYVDNNIRWFFICSTVAATTSLLCLIITSAALAAIQEQRSNEELYRSIYYDQGLVNQQHIKQQPIEISTLKELPSLKQPTEINNTEEPPSLSLQGSQTNDISFQEMHGQVEQNRTLPPAFYDLGIIDKDLSQQLRDNSEHTNNLGISGYSQEGFQHNMSEQSTSENRNSDHQVIHEETASGNIMQNMGISPDHNDTSTDTPVDHGPAMWKLTGTMLGIKNSEHQENRVRDNSAIMQNDSKTKSELFPTINVGNTTNSESKHIMQIANIKANETKHILGNLINNHDQELDSPATTNAENQFNRPKKSTDDYHKNEPPDYNDGHVRRVITEDEHTHLMTSNNEEIQDVMTIRSTKYESQAEGDVSHIIHTTDDSNQTLAEFSSSEQKFEHEPQYSKVRRGAREVRTVVAINILVASALELAWSLLSASIAWKGMRNYYPHESPTNCNRTVEGLERSLPPSSSPNNTFTNNKRHKTNPGAFRKPDIISNHRQCHTENSIHLSAIQKKNNINRSHMINTVSERINVEPYLPMEESTMEYQERVHRFLASNSVAINTSDNASNVDS